MTAEVRVEPAVLDRARTVCHGLRDDAGHDGSGTEDALQDAARGLGGWQTARSLEDLQWWWHDYRGKLGHYLDTLGEALHQTATAYQHADSASRDLFDIRNR